MLRCSICGNENIAYYGIECKCHIYDTVGCISTAVSILWPARSPVMSLMVCYTHTEVQHTTIFHLIMNCCPYILQFVDNKKGKLSKLTIYFNFHVFYVYLQLYSHPQNYTKTFSGLSQIHLRTSTLPEWGWDVAWRNYEKNLNPNALCCDWLDYKLQF